MEKQLVKEIAKDAVKIINKEKPKTKRNQKNKNRKTNATHIANAIANNDSNGKRSFGEVNPVAFKRISRRVENRVAQYAKSPSGRVKSDNSRGAIEQIAMSIAAPECVPAVRFVTEYTTEPTSISTPTSLLDASIGANTTYQALPPTETLAFVYRCPERNFIIYDSNTSRTAMTYHVYGCLPVGEMITVTPSLSWTLSFLDADTPHILHTPYALAASDYQPHGPKIYAGNSGDKSDPYRYFWLDDHTQLSVTYTISDTALSYTWSAIEFNSSGPSDNIIQTSHTGNGTNIVIISSAQHAGYYAISVSQVDSTEPNTMTVSNMSITDTGGAHFCHLTMPGYLSNEGVVGAGRVLASSLLESNFTDVLDKSGKIVGARLPKSSWWTDFVSTNGSFGLVGAVANKKCLDAIHGAYAFLKPNEVSDFELQQNTRVQNGILIDSFYPIQPKSGFIALSGSLGTSQNFQWTMTTTIEYTTNDLWRESRLGRNNSEQYKAALEILKSVDNFHTNDFHLSELWGKIKMFASKVLKGVETYGPTVVSTAAKLAPLFL